MGHYFSKDVRILINGTQSKRVRQSFNNKGIVLYPTNNHKFEYQKARRTRFNKNHTIGLLKSLQRLKKSPICFPSKSEQYIT